MKFILLTITLSITSMANARELWTLDGAKCVKAAGQETPEALEKKYGYCETKTSENGNFALICRNSSMIYPFYPTKQACDKIVQMIFSR